MTNLDPVKHPILHCKSDVLGRISTGDAPKVFLGGSYFHDLVTGNGPVDSEIAPEAQPMSDENTPVERVESSHQDEKSIEVRSKKPGDTRIRPQAIDANTTSENVSDLDGEQAHLLQLPDRDQTPNFEVIDQEVQAAEIVVTSTVERIDYQALGSYVSVPVRSKSAASGLVDDPVRSPEAMEGASEFRSEDRFADLEPSTDSLIKADLPPMSGVDFESEPVQKTDNPLDSYQSADPMVEKLVDAGTEDPTTLFPQVRTDSKQQIDNQRLDALPAAESVRRDPAYKVCSPGNDGRSTQNHTASVSRTGAAHWQSPSVEGIGLLTNQIRPPIASFFEINNGKAVAPFMHQGPDIATSDRLAQTFAGGGHQADQRMDFDTGNRATPSNSYASVDGLKPPQSNIRIGKVDSTAEPLGSSPSGNMRLDSRRHIEKSTLRSPLEPLHVTPVPTDTSAKTPTTSTEHGHFSTNAHSTPAGHQSSMEPVQPPHETELGSALHPAATHPTYSTSDARTLPSGAVFPDTATSLYPKHLAEQIAAHVTKYGQNSPGEILEIQLMPEELGRVVYRLSGSEQNAALSISVERPETLDILRRHASEILLEFEAFGIASENLTFEQDHHATPRDDGDDPLANDAGDDVLVFAPSQPTPTVLSQGSIDIRL